MGKSAFRILALAALLSAALPALPAQAQILSYLPFGRTHRLAKVLDSVVSITMIKLVSDDQGGTRRTENFGSGFIIDPSGIIATNRHVVAGMIAFTITLHGGTTYQARVIGVASNIDIALLKIDAEKPLPAVKWSDSDRLHIGDQVFAIGNPLGVGESVSEGIVSGLNRNIRISPFDDFIQTDAAINHGNSGGPLVDTRGEVVGINTAILSPGDTGSIGIGFAIPANDAQFMIGQLRQFGRLKLGWLGMSSQDVTADMAESVGLARPRGVIVSALEKGGPADVAGVEEGDIVLSFAGQPARDTRALARVVARARIGVAAPLVLWRDGHETTLPVTPTEWADAAPPADAKPPPAVVRPTGTNPATLGLQLAAITGEAREKYHLPENQAGVLVESVAPNTVASDRAIAPGDVILKVQQEGVGNPDDVQQQLAEALKQNRRNALVLVRRRDEQLWMSLPIAPSK